mgnify:CR=1 FL=1
MEILSAIIQLLGGLAMFLYGIELMGDGLKESSSGTLKKAMENVTNNPIKAFLLGLAVTWTRSQRFTELLTEFQNVVLAIVSRVVIPVLPFYIGTTFCALSYEGMITRQLPAFLQIIVIVMVGHFIWMALLYILAGAYSKKNPIEVVKHYGPAYITAVGTMSSAATLSVALECAHKSKVLRKDMVEFGVPLFANIHLCGSVLTEVFFVMTVAKVLYGQLPSVGTMVLFCFLLVCEVPMLALKFKNFGWADNKQRYVFLVGCLPLLLLGASSLAAIIVWYVAVSIFFPRIVKG